MSYLSAINSLLMFLVGSVCLAAAWTDIRRFEIPNRFPTAILVLFFLYVSINVIASHGSEIRWIASLGVGVAVFGAYMLLFAFGKMGGGDVKFAGAVALWAGPEYAIPFVVITSLVGLGLSVLYALVPKLGWYEAVDAKAHPEEKGVEPPPPEPEDGESPPPEKSIPYGVAIATAGIFVIIQLIIK